MVKDAVPIAGIICRKTCGVGRGAKNVRGNARRGDIPSEKHIVHGGNGVW